MQRQLHPIAFSLLCVSGSLRKVLEIFSYCAGFPWAGRDPRDNLPHPRPRIESLARIPRTGQGSILDRPPGSSSSAPTPDPDFS